MAGDWIKLEKCSPDKPEVMRLARLWGIPKDQAFGAIVRFWIWLDNASVDGVVDGVGSHEVDDMMHLAGFAKGLESVRWLEIDDAVPRIRVPNFCKHNSESAKKRALSNDRQASWRDKSNARVDAVVDAVVDAPSVTEPSTREEKRREEKKDQKQKSTALASRDAPPGVQQINWDAWLDHKGKTQTAHADRIQRVRLEEWASKGHDPNRVVEDAVSGAWKGLREPEERRQANRGPPQTLAERRARNMDILTGKVRDERSIDGVAERVGKQVVLTLPGDLREQDSDDVGGRGPERSAAGLG